MADENGENRAGLGLTKAGPALVLCDEKGQIRSSLAVGNEATKLQISDANGKDRVGLALDKNGPSLGLFDEKGGPRIGLGV